MVDPSTHVTGVLGRPLGSIAARTIIARFVRSPCQSSRNLSQSMVRIFFFLILRLFVTEFVGMFSTSIAGISTTANASRYNALSPQVNDKKFRARSTHSPRKEQDDRKLVAATQNCSKSNIKDEKLSTYSGDEKSRHEEILLELKQASVKGDGIVHEDGILKYCCEVVQAAFTHTTI